MGIDTGQLFKALQNIILLFMVPLVITDMKILHSTQNVNKQNQDRY